jgi:hypothetical protein
LNIRQCHIIGHTIQATLHRHHHCLQSLKRSINKPHQVQNLKSKVLAQTSTSTFQCTCAHHIHYKDLLTQCLLDIPNNLTWVMSILICQTEETEKIILHIRFHLHLRLHLHLLLLIHLQPVIRISFNLWFQYILLLLWRISTHLHSTTLLQQASPIIAIRHTCISILTLIITHITMSFHSPLQQQQSDIYPIFCALYFMN